MKKKEKIERYYYKGLWDCISYCGLEIINNNELYTVIASELKDNPGTSITNFYEHLATKIYHEKLNGIPIEDIIWIERYSDTDVEYSIVDLEWNGEEFRHLQWRYATRESLDL